jgi:predicted nucleic acid-binding protein
VILADTNILSTFAKIDRLPLLFEFFAGDRIGVVPAVYEEFRQGASKGYSMLNSVLELVQARQIELVMPTIEEILAKDALAASFDSGERETMAVAISRGLQIMTNEKQVKNWCGRTSVRYVDLSGLLRAFWRTNLLTKEEVHDLTEQIEAKDRIRFKDKESIFHE